MRVRIRHMFVVRVATSGNVGFQERGRKAEEPGRDLYPVLGMVVAMRFVDNCGSIRGTVAGDAGMGHQEASLKGIMRQLCDSLDADWCAAVPFHALEHHLPESIASKACGEEDTARLLVRLARSAESYISPGVVEQIREHGALSAGIEDLFDGGLRDIASSDLQGLRGTSVAVILLRLNEHELGAACAVRNEGREPFGTRDLQVLLKAFREHQRTGEVFPPPSPRTSFQESALVGALETGLPVTGAVFGEDHRLMWLSDEAADWLRVDAARVGTTVVTAGERSRLEILREAVREASREPVDDFLPLVCPPLEEDGHRIRVHCPRRESWGESLSLVLVSRDGEKAQPGSPRVDLESFGCTRREQDVALLAARGHTIASIAEQLGVTYNTAHTHLKKLYRKLGVCSRAGLTYLLFAGGDEQR